MTVERRTGEKRNELLQDTATLVERLLIDSEASPATAAAVANAVADRLATHWGGQVIYFPTDYHWKLASIELEIYDAFTGTNHVELARRFGMTDSGLRRLLNRIRGKIASHRHAQQGDLLDPPKES